MLHKSSIEWFETLGRTDVARVGGKNASLGEMVRTLGDKGIKVPPGFATTAEAYWAYIDANDLRQKITELVADWTEGRTTLAETGSTIRALVAKGDWPAEIAAEIAKSYRELSKRAGKVELARRGALERHRRRSPRCQLRRPAGDLSQHSRRGRPAQRLPPLLCLAVYRPGDQLSQGQGLRPHEGGAVDRRAADGALGSGRLGRDVLDRYRDRASTRSCSSMRRGGSAKTSSRARSIPTNTRSTNRSSPIPSWSRSSKRRAAKKPSR